jgi:hypothetical protein
VSSSDGPDEFNVPEFVLLLATSETYDFSVRLIGQWSLPMIFE